MITAKVARNREGVYTSFSCSGHAEYANKGKDIVCAAVSILVINTINSIEELTETEIEAEAGNTVSFRFINKPDEKAKVLMDALVLGLNGIQNEYGKKFLKLVFEEV